MYVTHSLVNVKAGRPGRTASGGTGVRPHRVAIRGGIALQTRRVAMKRR